MSESKIYNVPKITDDPILNEGRANIERRAQYLYFMIKEAKKHGLDYKFGVDAIARLGERFTTHKFDKMKDKGSTLEMQNFFANGDAARVFEMKKVFIDNGVYEVHYTYCPLLAGWQKLGCVTKEELDELCEIATAHDLGMCRHLDGIKFSHSNYLCHGGTYCAYRFENAK